MRRVACLAVLSCVLVAIIGCFVPNASPVAVFWWARSDLVVTFDAELSHDADGTIESYRWDFGDDSTGSGETTSHIYATDVFRFYSVTLTVTDDDGATGSVTNTVSVDPHPEPGPMPDPDLNALPR